MQINVIIELLHVKCQLEIITGKKGDTHLVLTLRTRMHSSRMCTARSSSRPGGGVGVGGLHQAHPPGADPPEQTPPRSRHPPTPPPLTESQTPVKILPCPNFVAGGKKMAGRNALFGIVFNQF